MQFSPSEIKIKLTGTRPFLMARGDAANPFDLQARQIKTYSQKKKKTDEDHEILARLQFACFAYYDEEIGFYIPTDNLWKGMENGANRYKEGPIVKSQVIIKGLVGKQVDLGAAKLIYKGPQRIDEIYEDKRFVSLKMGKIPKSKTSVLVCRPIFPDWSVEFIIEYIELTKERIMDYWNTAGRFIGIGAWRPRYGLFTAEILK